MRLIPVSILTITTLQASDLPDRAYDVLKKHCLACHGTALKASNLDLRTREAAMAGGERGEAVVPNYPMKSRLYLFATHQQNPTMPPGAKLAEADLRLLERWILAGAPWPQSGGSGKEPDAAGALRAMEERPITGQERAFWSFRKPLRPAVPSTGDRNPIDAFLRTVWDAKGLKPAPMAGKRGLIRRAYLDLLGLPPSPERVLAFVNDKSPRAWENLVDELLTSPQYGERWARYWLDLVRYADSGGYEYDYDWPNAWRYRDWVVNAINNDKPYDQFIREQIAGDEIDPKNPELRIATGYLRLGPENNLKNEQTRMDELDDIISTTALAFQGLTLGCARCHNHKFDPIPQKDYYQIQAVFFSTKASDFPLVDASALDAHKAENKRIDDLEAPHKTRRAEIEKPYRDAIFEEKVNKLAPYMQQAWRTSPEKRTEGQRLNARQIEKTLQIKDEEIVARLSARDKAEHETVSKTIAMLEKRRPEPYASARVIGEHGPEPLPSYFLHSGSPSNKGSVMAPGVFSVASWARFEPTPPPAGAETSYRRRSFADWIASPENPLTARVMVNRIWQRHFGEGIVPTPNNFGKKGEPPTHPELLDWLATEFVRTRWSLKAMHRLMMTSQAYRMASDDIESNLKIDASNRHLWRMHRQRLDVETIRDNMLALAGTLSKTLGGPPVHPYIDPALFQSSSKRTWPGKPDSDSSTWRRSLYVFNKRTIRYPLFESFDQPDMITSCARRTTSVTAPQALLLMNNNAVRMHAQQFAGRLRKDSGEDAGKQVIRAFELALARPPGDAELTRSVAFVRSGEHGLVDFCQAMFNINEFVFVP